MYFPLLKRHHLYVLGVLEKESVFCSFVFALKTAHVTAALQDASTPQLELAKLLKGTSGLLFVVGDEDQAIYSWWVT